MFELALIGIFAFGAALCVFAPFLAPLLPRNEETDERN